MGMPCALMAASVPDYSVIIVESWLSSPSQEGQGTPSLGVVSKALPPLQLTRGVPSLGPSGYPIQQILINIMMGIVLSESDALGNGRRWDAGLKASPLCRVLRRVDSPDGGRAFT